MLADNAIDIGEAKAGTRASAFVMRAETGERIVASLGRQGQQSAVHIGQVDRLFLCGWLGGPKRYQEKYGAIGIPRVHAHLPIGTAERDQWLTCMSESVAEQPFADDFKRYLMEQLYVPAEAVRRRCSGEPKAPLGS